MSFNYRKPRDGGKDCQWELELSGGLSCLKEFWEGNVPTKNNAGICRHLQRHFRQY